MELPPDDDGPVQDDAGNGGASSGVRRRASRPAHRWLRAPPLPPVPELPDDIEGDLPEELFGELVLDGPVQGPAGRAARPLAGKRKRGAVFAGRSRDELMQGLEMVPHRQPTLWNAVVPRHLDATLPDDLVEVYSPARIVPLMRRHGLRAELSVDLLTGWDLLTFDARLQLVLEIKRRRPKVLMMSPPCTWFSQLMNLNWAKIKPVLREQAFQDATMHLEFCMLLADLQQSQGRGWAFEHPDGAKSWHNCKVETLLKSGALVARFDQCCFGLVSKVDGTPMRKRTKVMTNMNAVQNAFDKKFCDCGHEHQVVQGSEGGEKRSVWAQRYPPMMCETAAVAFAAYCRCL